MTTCSVTGTTWREPEVSGVGPWAGTTYSLRTLLPPETDYSQTPEQCVGWSETTFSEEPEDKAFRGPPALADARD